MEQVIPTFDEIESTIGGRPPKEKKIRMSFYVSKQEAQILKAIAEIKDTPLSALVRELLKNMMHE
jgi:hypothetical protein